MIQAECHPLPASIGLLEEAPASNNTYAHFVFDMSGARRERQKLMAMAEGAVRSMKFPFPPEPDLV